MNNRQRGGLNMLHSAGVLHTQWHSDSDSRGFVVEKMGASFLLETYLLHCIQYSQVVGWDVNADDKFSARTKWAWKHISLHRYCSRNLGGFSLCEYLTKWLIQSLMREFGGVGLDRATVSAEFCWLDTGRLLDLAKDEASLLSFSALLNSTVTLAPIWIPLGAWPTRLLASRARVYG